MPSSYQQERLGIAAVAVRIAELGQIWRETSTGDFGIDGHIERLEDGDTPSGLMVGVQVKSGPSYLARETAAGFSYIISDKHQRYWEHYPVPVLLILHDPAEQRTYWTDVRQALRSGLVAGKTVAVPRTQVLEATDVDGLFTNAGVSPTEYVADPEALLRIMVATETCNAGFDMSYFDLFCLGMTNICRSLYFGMDLTVRIAEHKLAAADSEFGVGLGGPEYDFLEGYIRFLISQNLVHANYSDLRIDLHMREMMSKFIVPLSKRGVELKNAIGRHEDGFVASGVLDASPYRAAQEAFVEMVEMSMFPRFSRVSNVAQLLRPTTTV